MLLWIVACAVGWELGWNLGRAAQLLLGIVDVRGSYPLLAAAAAVGGAVVGVSLGVAQWLFLRGRAKRSLIWLLPATAFGGAVGRFAGIHAGLLVTGVLSLVLAGALLGFAIGLFQWIAIRRELGPPTAWISASTMGAALAAPLQFAAFDESVWFSYAAAGALYGLATGPVLLRFQHASMREEALAARIRI